MNPSFNLRLKLCGVSIASKIFYNKRITAIKPTVGAASFSGNKFINVTEDGLIEAETSGQINKNWVSFITIINIVCDSVSCTNQLTSVQPILRISTLIALPQLHLPNTNLNEALLIKRKNKDCNMNHSCNYDALNFDVYNSIVSLPIIYMHRAQLNFNKGVTIPRCCQFELNIVKIHQLFVIDNQGKGGAAAKVVDKKSSSDKVTKGMKPTIKTIGTSQGAVAQAKFGLGKTKGDGKNEKPKKGGRFSWTSIEAKLPGWQNTIADILQKMQNIVFKKR